MIRHNKDHGPVSRKSRKLFGPEKPFLSSYSVKLIFSYLVKGKKIKITAKFRAIKLRNSVDGFSYNKNMLKDQLFKTSRKVLGTFEKQVPAPVRPGSSIGRATRTMIYSRGRKFNSHHGQSSSSIPMFASSSMINIQTLISTTRNAFSFVSSFHVFFFCFVLCFALFSCLWLYTIYISWKVNAERDHYYDQ